MVLSRERNSNEGTLMVTGRDVEEAEYALTSDSGRWQVDGATFAESADIAHGRRGSAPNLSAAMLELLQYVEQRRDGVTSKEAVDRFGKSAYTMLGRLVAAGHLEKPGGGRGRYVVNISQQ
jgi:hypothetical protein